MLLKFHLVWVMILTDLFWKKRNFVQIRVKVEPHMEIA